MKVFAAGSFLPPLLSPHGAEVQPRCHRDVVDPETEHARDPEPPPRPRDVGAEHSPARCCGVTRELGVKLGAESQLIDDKRVRADARAELRVRMTEVDVEDATELRLNLEAIEVVRRHE